MPDNLSSILPETPTCDTLAGLSATRMDIKLAPPTAEGDLGTFAGHRVVRLIGTGGMGQVYEAIDPALERRVALKLLKPRYATNAQAVARFLAEGKAAAAIVDDYVVTIYHVNQSEGIPYLTMELLTGCTLQQHAQGKPVDEATAVRLARDIAAGLRAVHAASLVHRDVKPENVWIDARTGRARLLDFGLALRPTNVETSPEAEGLLGTPAYMSPEQAASEPLDRRSDLFSLGTVLYELLAGTRPFAGSSLRDVLESVRVCEPTDIRKLVPQLDERLTNLISRLLSRKADDRPASAEEVIAELSAIQKSMSRPSTSLLPVAPVKPTRRGYSLLALIPLSLLIVVSIVAIEWFLFPPTVTLDVPTPAKPAPPPKTTSKGWTPLFPDDRFTGWRPSAGDTFGAWRWEKDVLRGTPDDDDHLILTDNEFSDFELQLEYRWPDKGGHTSVMFRAGKEGRDDDGFHLNIGDDENFPAVHGRDIGEWYRTGSIYILGTTTQTNNKPIGEWNRLRLISNRNKVQTEINGLVLLTANLKEHVSKKDMLPALGRSKGCIGLKVHWGTIEFRNVQIRLLGE